jgi:hypothetical protein
MGRKNKLGNLVGVEGWEALTTVADVRRFLRWVVLSMRDTTLEPNHASIFAQIGGVLLKTVQASEFEKRLDDIEQRLTATDLHDDARRTTLPH